MILARHFLPFEILVSKDSNGDFVVDQVVNKKFSHAIDVMVLLIINRRALILAGAHLGGILRFIHVEFVFAVDVAAEVLWQISYFTYLDLKIDHFSIDKKVGMKEFSKKLITRLEELQKE